MIQGWGLKVSYWILIWGTGCKGIQTLDSQVEDPFHGSQQGYSLLHYNMIYYTILYYTIPYYDIIYYNMLYPLIYHTQSIRSFVIAQI